MAIATVNYLELTIVGSLLKVYGAHLFLEAKVCFVDIFFFFFVAAVIALTITGLFLCYMRQGYI
jgi:hypothetical protein